MPLLNLFSKKSKSPLKASSASHSTSNVSSGDNEWVSVNAAAAVASTGEQQQRSQQQQRSSSSSGGPTRVSNDESIYDPPIRHSSLFPFQGDKPGVFRSTQSLPGHNDPDTRPTSHKLSSSPPLLPVSSKKSFFNWVASRERSHTTSSVKSTSDSSDHSFNLKSFRHVRPESPSFNYTSTPSTTVLPRPPSPATPTLVPVPTSTLPPPPVSFQVTSRKPRPSPVSPLSTDISPTSSQSQYSSSQNTPQPRIVAGAFRQAARRSATSLSLGDPVVSPGIGLEDTSTSTGLGAFSFENDIAKTASILSSSPPKLSLSFSNSTTDVSTIFNNTSISRPPRSQPPPSLSNHHHPSSSNSYTQLNHSSASIPAPASTITLNSPILPPTSSSGPTSAKPTPSSSKSFPTRPSKPNYVDSSSEEDSDSEEEESESGSDDSDTGMPRVSRKRTVRPRNITSADAATSSTTNSPANTSGRPRAATTASAPSRPGTIVLEASSSKTDVTSATPTALTTHRPSLTDNPNPSLERFPVSTPVDNPSPRRPPSDVHPSGGARPRASASVGASAKEARASVILANSRLSTATNLSTPKAMAKPLSQNAGSDTSESSESESDSEKDSDEDAPLSKLVPPKRPGTSMSSYSTNSNSSLRTKPLVDLSAPSTFSGRPVGAPAPISREEEEMPKPRILVNTTGRSSPNLKNSSPNIKMVSLPQAQSSPQQQPGQRLSKALLSSTSSMSSPSSSGASLATSSRGVGGASSDTSTSPIDHYSKYHSFANGLTNDNGSTRSGAGTSPSKSSPTNLPPTRPFLRRESPATSSTGDSSSGKVPLTPKDGNDIRQRSQLPSSALVSGKDRRNRPTHGRKPSVTFEDEAPLADKGVKSGGNSHTKPKESDLDAEEAKRRERRRGEARAAIELGKVVNGPPPVDDEEVGLDASAQAMWPQFGMQMPMQAPMPMPMQPMFPMGASASGMGGMGMQPQLQMGFPSPMPNNDPTFLVAHQQAMSIAKQAYQYAVAQQALAAANDEWERSSTMTGFMPVNGYMNMNMRGSVAFPPAPASMYAGNTGGGGSLINGFGGLGGGAGAWGETRSVYGGSFGPAAPMGMRLSTYSSTDLTAFNPALVAAPVGNVGVGGPAQGRLAPQRPGVRQRTRTAPSSPVPPSHGNTPPLPSPSKSAVRNRAPAPPSSFRGVPNQ